MIRGTRLRLEWEPALVGLGMLGLVLDAVCVVAALMNGGWFVEPEGRLMDGLRFEVGAGIFCLPLLDAQPDLSQNQTGNPPLW